MMEIYLIKTCVHILCAINILFRAYLIGKCASLIQHRDTCARVHWNINRMFESLQKKNEFKKNISKCKESYSEFYIYLLTPSLIYTHENWHNFCNIPALPHIFDAARGLAWINMIFSFLYKPLTLFFFCIEVVVERLWTWLKCYVDNALQARHLRAYARERTLYCIFMSFNGISSQSLHLFVMYVTKCDN